MYIAYTEEQEALRKELRAYYEKLLTPEIRDQLAAEHGVGPVHRKVIRQMGKDGWLGIGWPTEYGGQGRSRDRAVHLLRRVDGEAGAPVPDAHASTPSGPRSTLKHGTDEQKQFFLPKILKGEIHFCIGYSEPQAGTDLAALSTRADLRRPTSG